MTEKTSINDFISHFTDFARSNLFHVSIDGISLDVPSASEHLFMSCKGVQVPGITFTEGKYIFRGFNRKFAIGADLDPVTLTFFVDSSGKTLEIFEEWSNKILNRETGKFGFKEDYQCELSILMLDRTGESYDIVLLKNAYPTNIETVDLSWESSDSIMELSVSFNFDKMKSSFDGTAPKFEIPKMFDFAKIASKPFNINIPTFSDVQGKLPIDIKTITAVTDLVNKLPINIPKPEILPEVISKTNIVSDLVTKTKNLF